MPNINKRDVHTGEQLVVKKEYVPVKSTVALPPDQPLADTRVENFLMDIVENAVTGTQRIYARYRQYGFPDDAPEPIIKNQMRLMLSAPEVKERLKYLRASEWELNRPDITQVSKKFQELIEEEDLKPNDKINALNSLAKLVGLFEPEKKETGTKVAVIFNSKEAPPPPIIKVN